MVLCKCVFLDGKEVDITVDKEATGSDLYESLCKYMGITYRDPFGIAFRGGTGPAPYSWWVRMEKTLKGQIPGKCKIWEFAFLVKYYPKTLAGMQDEIARYHVIMQIRQDLLTGRLKCPVQTMSHLCSYWLQAQYGDWSSRHIDMQLADAFRFVQKGEQRTGEKEEKSDLDFVEQMMQIHQTHRGMPTRDADYRFIRLAASLPNYGIHYYPAYLTTQPKPPQSGSVKNRSRSTSSLKGEATAKIEKVTIGIGPLGIHQYRKRGNEIVYTWKAMRAVSFKRNQIVLKMQGAMRENLTHESKQQEEGKKSQKVMVKEFGFEDLYQTKIIWQVMIEYHMFFRVGDQQGLKADQRKHLINSLKFKRSIPMVGEKKAATSAKSPSSTVSPRSGTRFSFSLGRAGTSRSQRSSSVPPRREGEAAPQSSSPKPESRIQLLKKNGKDRSSSVPNIKNDAENYEKSPSEEISTQPPSARSDASQQRQGRIPDSKESGAIPASYVSTPISGTFLFPQRSQRGRPGSEGRRSTTWEDEILNDNLSDATDNTDALCSPSIMHSAFSRSEDNGVNKIGYWEETLTPRSQVTTNGSQPQIPKLQLDEAKDHGKHDDHAEEGDVRDSSPQRFENGPFVIPAEILIGDLRNIRKLKEEGVELESKPSDFPMELDFEHQPRRSRYMKDSQLIGVYDHEFWKQSSTPPYEGRRVQSMASLRTKPKEVDNVTPRERSLSPKSEQNASAGKPIGHGFHSTRSRQPEKIGQPERAKSESRLPRPSNVNQKPHTARSTHVSRISDLPAAKPRTNLTLPKRKATGNRYRADEGAANIMRSNPEILSKDPPQRVDTIPKIPPFIRSVV